MVTLTNTITILQKDRKNSSAVFKDVQLGDVIELKCPIDKSNAIAGQTLKVEVSKNNQVLGLNKLAQLSSNLSSFELYVEKGVDKRNYETFADKYGRVDLKLTRILKVVEIKKKTTAKLFKNLKTGDFLTIILDVNKRGIPGVKIKTETEETSVTPSVLRKILGCFEFEELE